MAEKLRKLLIKFWRNETPTERTIRILLAKMRNIGTLLDARRVTCLVRKAEAIGAVAKTFDSAYDEPLGGGFCKKTSVCFRSLGNENASRGNCQLLTLSGHYNWLLCQDIDLDGLWVQKDGATRHNVEQSSQNSTTVCLASLAISIGQFVIWRSWTFVCSRLKFMSSIPKQQITWNCSKLIGNNG